MDTTRRIRRRCTRETRLIRTDRRKRKGGERGTDLGFDILSDLTFLER